MLTPASHLWHCLHLNHVCHRFLAVVCLCPGQSINGISDSPHIECFAHLIVGLSAAYPLFLSSMASKSDIRRFVCMPSLFYGDKRFVHRWPSWTEIRACESTVIVAQMLHGLTLAGWWGTGRCSRHYELFCFRVVFAVVKDWVTVRSWWFTWFSFRSDLGLWPSTFWTFLKVCCSKKHDDSPWQYIGGTDEDIDRCCFWGRFHQFLRPTALFNPLRPSRSQLASGDKLFHSQKGDAFAIWQTASSWKLDEQGTSSLDLLNTEWLVSRDCL